MQEAGALAHIDDFLRDFVAERGRERHMRPYRLDRRRRSRGALARREPERHVLHDRIAEIVVFHDRGVAADLRQITEGDSRREIGKRRRCLLSAFRRVFDIAQEAEIAADRLVELHQRFREPLLVQGGDCANMHRALLIRLEARTRAAFHIEDRLGAAEL
jgi:hypothetical protein